MQVGGELARRHGELKVVQRPRVAHEVGPPEVAVFIPRRPAGQFVAAPVQVGGQHVLPAQELGDLLPAELLFGRPLGDIPVQAGLHFGQPRVAVVDIEQGVVSHHRIRPPVLPPHLVAADGLRPHVHTVPRLRGGDVRLGDIADFRYRGLVAGGVEQGWPSLTAGARRPHRKSPRAAHQHQRRRQRAVLLPRPGPLGGGVQPHQLLVEGVRRLDMVHIVLILLHAKSSSSVRYFRRLSRARLRWERTVPGRWPRMDAISAQV